VGAHAVLIAWLAVSPAASPESPASSRADASVASAMTPRTPQELRLAVRRALRRQSSTTGSEQTSALGELVGVYRELRASTQMTDDERRELAGIVRSRLARVSKDLERQLSKAEARHEPSPALPADRLSPDNRAILAQVRGNPARRQPGAAAGRANLARPGGVGAPGGPAQALADMTAENARQLIDLIQTTIAPGSWDVRGGPGTMVYFAPKMVLVASQSEEVHEQIGQFIQALRGQ
jgi:hypothetical protein